MFSSNTTQVSDSTTYIEDVFSTWLYNGNGATQTITNGIDLAGRGGLVWLKRRNGAVSHILFDTARSTGSGDPFLQTNTTDAQVGATTNYLTYLSNGFTLENAGSGINASGDTQVSWTFREQPKFFDVVTYTGNGASNRQISHALGSVPGCIIIKSTSAAGTDWVVWHRGIYSTTGTNQYIRLNSTDASGPVGATWISNIGEATFTLATSLSETNTNGATYVAYLFAHNAGGFGLSGNDNVISCGSFTTNDSGVATVDLGYEPQWVMVKKTNAGDEVNSGFWWMQDNMRGYPVRPGNSQYLQANTSDPETAVSSGGLTLPTSTGFVFNQNYSGFHNATFIYIAIRRGPMRVPTTGTSVFDPEVSSGVNGTAVTTGFQVDLQLYRATGALDNTYTIDRLRGVNTTAVNTVTARLFTSTTGVETTDAVSRAWGNTGFQVGLANSGINSIYWNFRRAPGFFDAVCYTGNNNVDRNVNHNLGVIPEIIIIKCRNSSTDGDSTFPAGWWTAIKGSGTAGFWFLPSISNGGLNSSNAASYTDPWSAYFSSSSTFNPLNVTLSSGSGVAGNVTGQTYVAYLFASCSGVSRVGSYTGTGAVQVINCGFTAGARFVLIKATSTTGNWFVWDSARGIVAGNDPYLALNSTAVEVTNTDWVDTAASGFELSNAGGNLANSSGVSYIFLAIA